MGSQENKNGVPTTAARKNLSVTEMQRSTFLDIPMNHSLLHCITRTPIPPDVAVNSNEGKKWTRGYRLYGHMKQTV